jgi:hypothetical protein
MLSGFDELRWSGLTSHPGGKTAGGAQGTANNGSQRGKGGNDDDGNGDRPPKKPSPNIPEDAATRRKKKADVWHAQLEELLEDLTGMLEVLLELHLQAGQPNQEGGA